MKSLIAIFAIVIMGTIANAQIRVDVQPGFGRQGCYPYPVGFKAVNLSSKTPVAWNWNFGDKKTNNSPSTDSTVLHTYLTGSPDTTKDYRTSCTITYSDGSKSTATFGPQIIVWDHPKAQISLSQIQAVQCFKTNKYCYKQSSKVSKHKWPITDYFWAFGDGQNDTGYNPGCHHYQSPGFYSIALTIKDAKGCQDTQTVSRKIQILPNLKPTFTINSKPNCKITAAILNNTTFDTTDYHVTKFYWDFADSTPLDSVNWNPPKHFYTKGGKFYPTFEVWTKEGCHEKFKATSPIINYKYTINLKFPDSLCWSLAKQNVTFSIDPIDGFYYTEWNFDDPPSGLENVKTYTWTQAHAFVKGPRNYQIKFKADHIAGKDCAIDTCFLLFVKGPQARLNITPPAPHPGKPLSTFRPSISLSADWNIKHGTKYDTFSRSMFNDITNRRLCAKTIDYSIYTYPNGKTKTAHYAPQFCDITTKPSFKGVKTYDTLCNGPNGKKLIMQGWDAAQFKFKASSYKTVMFVDSLENKYQWKFGDPLPKAGVLLWSQSSGGNLYSPNNYDTALFYNPATAEWSPDKKPMQNIHDSDKYKCEYPNWVQFTNNSKKFRLGYNAWDDQYPNPIPDKCLDRNWPYSSDSLLYLWEFQDSRAGGCTSTYAKHNDTCNYSTEAAPLHYFANKTYDPDKRSTYCYTIKMTVTDTSRYGKAATQPMCDDVATFQILMGPPSARWNTKYYCHMNWYIQNYIGWHNARAPRKGFMLSEKSLPCALGATYKYKIDFSETLPGVCEAPQNYWVCFDSAAGLASARANNDSLCMVNPHKVAGKTVYDTIWNMGFLSKKILTGLPYLGNWWYNIGDSGCKTIGVVIQNGNCVDTTWYHNYICFNKLEPRVSVIDSATRVQLKPVVNYDPTQTSIGALTDGSKSYPKKWWNEEYDITQSPVALSGRICSNDTAKYSPAATISVAPVDTNQTFITSFHYDISREENTGSVGGFDANDYYYSVPFWPNEVSLSNNYSDQADITSTKDIVYIPKFGGGDTVYFKYDYIDPTTGKATSQNLPLFGNSLYLTKAEIISLNKTGSATIDPKDARAQALDFSCQYPITIFTAKKPVAIKDSILILDLSDPKWDDHYTKGKANGHDTVHFKLPYPGVYKLSISEGNIDGCTVNQVDYRIINGHLAFFTSPDSVSCLNSTVHFNGTVRYFSLDPVNTAILYDGLNQPRSGIWENSTNPVSGSVIPFNPWDRFDSIPIFWPDSVRKSIDRNWKLGKNYRREEPVRWDFGDGSPLATGLHVAHTYKQPGVYTVRMITTDSNGCVVHTQRKNFVKIIKVQPKFSVKYLRDTINYCAPVLVTIIDSTDISLGVGTYQFPKKRKNVFAYKDKYIGSCYDVIKKKNVPCIKDTVIIFDSITTWVWNQGDGRPNITRTSLQADTLAFTYTRNDTFDMFAKITTLRSCNDSLLRKKYLIVAGPHPKFNVVGDYKGCLPFTLKVRNHELNKTASYLWNKSDGTSQNTVSTDSFVYLTYTHLDPKDSAKNLDSSVFPLYLTQSDSIFNLHTGTKQLCSATWPHASDTVINITVYRRDVFSMKGDTAVCPGEPVKLKAFTKSRTVYESFTWDMGDGSPSITAKDSVAHIYTKPGVYTVLLRGKTLHCGDSIITRQVLVESAHADFIVDSITGADHCEFYFKNKSQDSCPDCVRYQWTYISQTATNTITVNDTNVVKHQFESEVPIDNSKDKKEFRFQIKLKAITESGCEDTISKFVRCITDFQPWNIMTPNGDGQNDVFDPKVVGEKTYNIEIYNRWGEKVFAGDDKSKDWNGQVNNTGVECPSGTYYWIIHFDLIGKTKGDKSGVKRGTVTIAR
ncbi:MAG: PKD domain-containing protein [Bacteroidetes bacterium]|nr:PKD domain-containing protein [Bacteroidota bacterium]